MESHNGKAVIKEGVLTNKYFFLPGFWISLKTSTLSQSVSLMLLVPTCIGVAVVSVVLWALTPVARPI